MRLRATTLEGDAVHDALRAPTSSAFVSPSRRQRGGRTGPPEPARSTMIVSPETVPEAGRACLSISAIRSWSGAARPGSHHQRQGINQQACCSNPRISGAGRAAAVHRAGAGKGATSALGLASRNTSADQRARDQWRCAFRPPDQAASGRCLVRGRALSPVAARRHCGRCAG